MPKRLDHRDPATGRFDTSREVTEQMRRIVELRDQDLTFVQIGERVGIDKSNAIRQYRKALSLVVAPAVDKHRDRVRAGYLTDLERLDDLLAEAIPLVRDGRRFDDLTDVGAVVSVLRERRMLFEAIAKLDGLNAPVRHDVKVADAWLDEIEQLAAELARTGAGAPTASPG